MGGQDPNGFQSVMERSDLVKRVIPPICTIPNTRVEVERSHLPTGAWGLRDVEVRRGRPLVYILDRGGDDAMIVLMNTDSRLLEYLSFCF